MKSGWELSERHIILRIIDPQEQTYYIKTVKVNQNTIRRSQTLGDKLWNGGLSRTSCLYCRILCLLIFFHFFVFQIFSFYDSQYSPVYQLILSNILKFYVIGRFLLKFHYIMHFKLKEIILIFTLFHWNFASKHKL